MKNINCYIELLTYGSKLATTSGPVPLSMTKQLCASTNLVMEDTFNLNVLPEQTTIKLDVGFTIYLSTQSTPMLLLFRRVEMTQFINHTIGPDLPTTYYASLGLQNAATAICTPKLGNVCTITCSDETIQGTNYL